LDHRCGSRAEAGLVPPRSLPGGLHRPARAPHGHHGCHRDPSLGRGPGCPAPPAGAHRPPGVTARALVTCVLGRMGMGAAPCTFFRARCHTHHPGRCRTSELEVPDQRARGSGPASWRAARGWRGGRSQASGARASARGRWGLLACLAAGRAGPDRWWRQPRFSLIVASMVKRRRVLSQSAYGAGQPRSTFDVARERERPARVCQARRVVLAGY
jgi:hypothetical protein